VTPSSGTNSRTNAFKGMDADLDCVITEDRQEAQLVTQAIVSHTFPRNRDDLRHAWRALYAWFGSEGQRLITASGCGKGETPCRSQANPGSLLQIIQHGWSLTPALSGLTFVLLSAAVSPQAFASEKRAQAPALFPNVQMEGFELQRKNFRFGEFSGWLKRDGTWHIEGPVRHNGLLCGTYEVGMRFGVGDQGCTSVQWISDTTYVTSEYQCNDAERPHSGTEIDDTLSRQFDAISCAERVIRCTGNCK
jgi:hypothetical protein